MCKDDELTNNISKYLAQKIESEDKSTFRIIAELLTLLSSVAALVGAGVALYTSYASLGVQTKLDRNQIFINENDVISSLWYQRCDLEYKDKDMNGLKCNIIPLADTNKWNLYYQCLYGIEVPENKVEFGGVSNNDRVRCMIEKVKFCRIEPVQNQCVKAIHNKSSKKSPIETLEQ